MKALTLTQPWATLVAEGVKRVETRDWACPGWQIGHWLAIHAGRSFGGLAGTGFAQTSAGLKQLCDHDPWYTALADAGYLLTTQMGLTERTPVDMLRLPLGGVVAVARVTGCVPTEIALPQLEQAAVDDSRWATEIKLGGYGPERFAWKLSDIHKIEPAIPCGGQRQLWDLPIAVEQDITRRFTG